MQLGSGEKRPEREAIHSPPSTVDIKNVGTTLPLSLITIIKLLKHTDDSAFACIFTFR